MKKQIYIYLTTVLSFIIIAVGCSGGLDYDPPAPNPGFGIYSSRSTSFGFDTVLPYARTEGEVGRSLFGTLVGVGSNATGTYYGFDETANAHGKAICSNRIAPAFYRIQAVSGWAECTGQQGTTNMDRGVFNKLTCQEIRFGGPILGGPSFVSTIDVNAAPVEILLYGEGINSTYGMPTFQFYNQYGTLMAQTTATEIDTENGFWARGWSGCLAGLPVGPYNTVLMNATADGTGQRIAATGFYLTGGPNMLAIDDPGFFVNQHYLDFLNREPDEGGWQNWVSQITQCGSNSTCIASKRIDVSRGFWYSDEFSQLHSGLRNPAGVAPDFNNAEFVRLCFVIYLRRDPDQETYNFRLAQLNSTNDYNQIISAFINSDEYRARFVPQPSEPPPPPEECPPCPPNIACLPCNNY